MSISEEDKELFRNAVEKIKHKKPKEFEGEVSSKDDSSPSECYRDEHDVTPVAADDKLSFFNPTLPYKVRKQLQQGKFAIEDALDLHKLTAEEAREIVAGFLQESSNDGLRCVLIVHGKGHGIEAPILKNKIKQWLPQSRYVLAFCTCIPKHGGTGAVYVLLR